MRYYDTLRSLIERALNGENSQDLIIELSEALNRVKPTLGVKKKLTDTYRREILDGKISKYHKGLKVFNINMLRPELRQELDRRIAASVDLITLNADTSKETTIRRFSGWVTSLPTVEAVRDRQKVDKRAVIESISKPMRKMSFEERRVVIDQNQKLISNLNDIIAHNSGALGFYWHSHWREVNYDYRHAHKELDEEFFVIRDNWAMKEGLMKKGGCKYQDELVSQVGQEPFCRCFAEYVYRLDRVPSECLTTKGLTTLKR